jgi:hypothetical protein
VQEQQCSGVLMQADHAVALLRRQMMERASSRVIAFSPMHTPLDRDVAAHHARAGVGVASTFFRKRGRWSCLTTLARTIGRQRDVARVCIIEIGAQIHAGRWGISNSNQVGIRQPDHRGDRALRAVGRCVPPAVRDEAVARAEIAASFC